MLEHVEKFYYGLNISSYQYHKCNYRNNNTYILVAQTVKNLPAMQETQVCSLGWEDPLEKEMATHCSILAGAFRGQRSLVGYSPWGPKESNTAEQLTHTRARC